MGPRRNRRNRRRCASKTSIARARRRYHPTSTAFLLYIPGDTCTKHCTDSSEYVDTCSTRTLRIIADHCGTFQTRRHYYSRTLHFTHSIVARGPCKPVCSQHYPHSHTRVTTKSKTAAKPTFSVKWSKVFLISYILFTTHLLSSHSPPYPLVSPLDYIRRDEN